MILEPLCVRVANGKAGLLDVAAVLSRSSDQQTAAAASFVASGESTYPFDFQTFAMDFRSMMKDVAENGILHNTVARDYLNSYMASSLVEDSIDTSHKKSGEVSRTVRILDCNEPWAEGLVCYNFCLFVASGGIPTLKSCKKCGSFFTNKGKYASYCSDRCKGKTQ